MPWSGERQTLLGPEKAAASGYSALGREQGLTLSATSTQQGERSCWLLAKRDDSLWPGCPDQGTGLEDEQRTGVGSLQGLLCIVKKGSAFSRVAAVSDGPVVRYCMERLRPPLCP